MVATSSPQAALAGLAALDRGGNACDAALAAAGMLAVCEPNQCGPGGDLFAIVVQDGRPPVGLNASGRSPADPGDALPQEFGPTSVTVPGCVAGWADLAGRFSRLGLHAALEPAILAAESGVVIAPRAASLWRAAHAELDGDAAACFELRDPFTNPQIARALRAAGDGSFYTGAVAEAIASVCWLSADDLAGHRTTGSSRFRFASATTPCSSSHQTARDRSPAGRSRHWRTTLARRPRWKRWPTPICGDTPGSVGRRTPVPRTPRGWRYR
jgi:gamma-glutamyltranspeptidase/glutathione hydrolase